MADYAIATPCSGGFLAHLEAARSGCTVQNAANRVYCCSDAVARSLPGGRNLPAAAGGSAPAPAGGSTPAAADDTGTPWIQGQWDAFLNAVGAGGQSSGGKTQQDQAAATGKLNTQIPGAQQAIDAGMQDGVAEAGGQTQPPAPPASWMSSNWPIVAVGGVVLVGAILFGTYALSKGKSVPNYYPTEA